MQNNIPRRGLLASLAAFFLPTHRSDANELLAAENELLRLQLEGVHHFINELKKDWVKAIPQAIAGKQPIQLGKFRIGDIVTFQDHQTSRMAVIGYDIFYGEIDRDPVVVLMTGFHDLSCKRADGTSYFHVWTEHRPLMKVTNLTTHERECWDAMMIEYAKEENREFHRW